MSGELGTSFPQTPMSLGAAGVHYGLSLTLAAPRRIFIAQAPPSTAGGHGPGEGHILHMNAQGTITDTRRVFSIPRENSDFGTSVDVGDLDRDGEPDLLVGAAQWVDPTQQYRAAQNAGYVSLYLGAAQLSSDRATFSSTGAALAQQLFVNAGATFPGAPFVMLGSISGPVVPGPFHLVPDAYTLFTLQYPGLPPLSANALGTLDPQGRLGAPVTFTWPTGFALPVAVQVHHAFVTFGPAGITSCSNAVPLTITP
jgi:hypothetical protein